MLTVDEYDELKSQQLMLEDMSCSCHINPPCEKCVSELSDEDLEAIKEYEKEHKINA